MSKTGFCRLNVHRHQKPIQDLLGMSKKHFKQCTGQLYKARKIQIQPENESL